LTDTIVVAKFDQDGNPLWLTRSFDSQLGFLPTDIDVDAAGNVYVSYIELGGNANVDCYESATGAFRWSQTVLMDQSDPRVNIAVRSAGNSTFVYAGATTQGTTGPRTRIARINSVNGGISHLLNVEGVHTAHFRGIEADANGNVIFSAVIDGLAVYRKVNQSLNPVWSQVFAETQNAVLAVNPTTNRVLAISGAPGDALDIRSLSGVNGSIVDSNVLPDGAVVRQALSNVFGTWYLEQSIDESVSIVGLTASLKPFLTEPASKLTTNLTVDVHGQAHFGTNVSQPGTVALRRVASNGFFEAVLPTASGSTAVTGDSLGRMILAGRQITGEAILFQLDQPFLANTDVIVRDFTGTLDIEAPGVLANDTNWQGGTISVVTPPVEGTVTLNADGSFQYVPGPTYDGTDQFQYRITKNGVPRTATCVVKQLIITQLTLDESSVIGQLEVQGTIGINNGSLPTTFRPTFNFSSSVAELSTPTEFRLGQTQGRFRVKTRPVVATTVVAISVSASGQTRSVNLTVLPGGLQSIQTINNAPLLAGQSSVLVVRLTGLASSDQTFGLLYQGSINGPQIVTIPAGQLTKNITVNVAPGTEGQTATVRAFAGLNAFTFEFPIQAKPTLDRIELIDNVVYAGTNFLLRGRLTSQAGTSSISSTLAVNNSTVTVPATIFFQAGASTGTANVSASLIAANKIVTFTSTLEGVTKTLTVLIRPNLLENFTVSPKTLNVRQVSTGTVFLNWVATGRGQPVVITTDKPQIVSVPTGITIPTGQTNRSFTIKALAAGTASVSVRIGDKKITQTLTITP